MSGQADPILQLLEQTKEQYEEYVKLSKLAERKFFNLQPDGALSAALNKVQAPTCSKEELQHADMERFDFNIQWNC